MSSPPRDAKELVQRYQSGERHFGGIRLLYAKLSEVDLHGANLEGANLEGADLDGANLTGAYMEEANLERANLTGANLTGACMAGAKLKGADLDHAALRGANLERAILEDATLEGANLAEANLERANLDGANLKDACLADANLVGADLMGVKLPEANLVGAVLSRANLAGAVLPRANLERAYMAEANLERANLTGANLKGAKLYDVNLARAKLAGADMEGAALAHAVLRGADLARADLQGAALEGADLEDANLTGVNLQHADLYRTHIVGATCTEIILSNTRLLSTNLAPLCDVLHTIRFWGPCPLNHESILHSILSPNLKGFLQKAGMPEVFIEFMLACAKSLTTDVFSMFKSTFISFGSPDEPFAKKLYDALYRNGVTTFFFPEHAVPGDKLHRMMRKGVNEHDRVILVCSKSSLDRKGVLNEIEETLAREARDGGASYLIPIRLDDYVFSGWKPPNPDIAQALRDRVVADFEGADTDPSKFDTALFKLIGALKK